MSLVVSSFLMQDEARCMDRDTSIRGILSLLQSLTMILSAFVDWHAIMAQILGLWIP